MNVSRRTRKTLCASRHVKPPVQLGQNACHELSAKGLVRLLAALCTECQVVVDQASTARAMMGRRSLCELVPPRSHKSIGGNAGRWARGSNLRKNLAQRRKAPRARQKGKIDTPSCFLLIGILQVPDRFATRPCEIACCQR
jgi:hypothetical protein